MDSALELKIASESGTPIHEERITNLLQRSALVKELTAEMPKTPMALVWRLMCISEDPLANGWSIRNDSSLRCTSDWPPHSAFR